MLNHITIQGRLTREPELRTTQSGVPVATFALACDRDLNREEVDFINCVAWRKTGEFVSKYFSKGQLALVTGRLQTRSYTDREGQKRTTTEVIVDNVYFCGSKRESGGDGYSAGEPEYRAPQAPAAVEDDGDIPF